MSMVVGCSAKTNCRERFCIAVPEGQFASNWFEDYTDKKQIKKNNRKLLAMQCYHRPAKVCICTKGAAVQLSMENLWHKYFGEIEASEIKIKQEQDRINYEQIQKHGY